MIEQFKLNGEGIDAASEKISEYLAETGAERKDILRMRLGLEEALLRYMDQFGSNTDFELKGTKRFGRTTVSVYVEGHMFDPFVKTNNAEQNSAFMRAALANMGELPIWRYSRGENIVSYSLSKKHLDSWVHLLIAIGMAILVALLLKLFPQNVADVFRDEIMTPLLDTFMNLLSAIAGPMIFLAVVWGIYSIGDVSAFSVIGKKLFLRLIGFCSLFVVVLGVMSLPLFNFASGEQQAVSGFSSLFRMVLDIVPGNIFKPFLEGNTLQILFIAVVMGISMIIIGEKTQTIAVFAEQLNYIVQLVMEFISKLVPVFVFGSLLNIILNNQIEDVKVSYKLFLIIVGAYAILAVVYVLLICIRFSVKPSVFISKVSKSFIICLTTASSSAAFSTVLETCTDEYGIAPSLTNFGVPFAQVLYKPTVAILYFSSAAYVAELYGTPVTTVWFITALFISIVLSVATPPIPGGTVASISVLFMQLGLPIEGLAVVMALNIIVDFLGTPVGTLGSQSMLILAADKFRMLDRNVLRRAKDKA